MILDKFLSWILRHHRRCSSPSPTRLITAHHHRCRRPLAYTLSLTAINKEKTWSSRPPPPPPYFLSLSPSYFPIPLPRLLPCSLKINYQLSWVGANGARSERFPPTDPVSFLHFTCVAANHIRTKEQGDIKCNTDRMGHTNWANTKHTRLNYEWLFKHGGEWKAKAGETGRIRCSESSAIYVINTVHRHPFLWDLLSPPPRAGDTERDANENGIGMNRRPTTSWFRMLTLRFWHKTSRSLVISGPEEGAGKSMERGQMIGGLLSSFRVRRDVYACSAIKRHEFLFKYKISFPQKVMSLTWPSLSLLIQ